jgi:hypothetical protein
MFRSEASPLPYSLQDIIMGSTRRGPRSVRDNNDNDTNDNGDNDNGNSDDDDNDSDDSDDNENDNDDDDSDDNENDNDDNDDDDDSDDSDDSDDNENDNDSSNYDDDDDDWVRQLSFSKLQSHVYLIEGAIRSHFEVISGPEKLRLDNAADLFNEDRFNEMTEGLGEEALWKFISQENEPNSELCILIVLGALGGKDTCLSMLENIVRREVTEQPAGDVTVITQRRGGIGFNLLLGAWIIIELQSIITQSSRYQTDRHGAELNVSATWGEMVKAGVMEQDQAEPFFDHLLDIVRHLLEFLQIEVDFLGTWQLDSAQKERLATLRANMINLRFNFKLGLPGAITDAALLTRGYDRGQPAPPMGEGNRPILEERHQQIIERDVLDLTNPKDPRARAEEMLRSMQAAATRAQAYRLDITGDEMNEHVPDGDKIPLLSVPLPKAGENYSQWLYPLKGLTIYDSRNGGYLATVKLRPSHYIYRLLDYFRCSLLRRENAAKYALMLRASHMRYHDLESDGMSVHDFFLNEPGPTAAESEFLPFRLGLTAR